MAKAFSDAGARVILVARRLELLESLSTKLGNARALSMNVADQQSVKQGIAALEQAGEHIDICVNNAGIVQLTPVFTTETEEEKSDPFESIIQTNLMGVWYVTKAIAHHMKNQKIHAAIINISSVNGTNRVRKGIAAYAASKAAVIQMTKVLVGDLSPYHIRINCVVPGLFHTPLTDHKLDTNKKKADIAKTIPLGFVATPQDLNGAVLLLASNTHARYMTGSCITVDGGISWGGNYHSSTH